MNPYTAWLSGRHPGNVVLQKGESADDPLVPLSVLLGPITRLLCSQLVITGLYALKPYLQVSSCK